MGEKSIAWAIRRSLNGGSRKRRARLVYGFAALISLATFVLLWCTSVFRDAILSNLELRNGTPTFLMWQRPPVGLRVNVYVFNYTNVHEFESGNASKLKVQEVGPFVYREKFSRANVRLDENRTVTYQEERSFQWIAGKSESQKVIVPNVLLMSTLAYSRDLNYLLQIGFTMLLAGLKLRAKPFLELPVGEFFWGYEDELFEMGKRFLPSRKFLPHDKFGILAFRNGLNADRITMHTGIDDLRNLGLIQRINGRESRRVWEDEKCDRIYGTDGSMFPPDWIEQPNATLYVYAKEFCRQLPFRYERRSFSNGIPTLRYKLPSNVFTSSRSKDSCFCPKESYDSITRICPPAGTLNVSACNSGSPLIVSFPHFYSGDESLFQKIEGLTPREEHHGSYVDLHSRLGVTVATRMRFQLNLEVRKAVGMPFSGNLEDGSILPLIWIDTRMDDLPESIRQIFYRSHYLVNAIEAGLQWCSLVGVVISFGAFLAALKREDESNGAKPVVDRTELDRL
ncbi:scavenger receptor class B member 1-like [Bombus impatiens]|uniref:Scavenger receptor class B member 1-like n=1 Tax=Bombus impatiens TaxID=132113 RepID=A0A6P8LV15_BOMIM|nr:scavenger receptor class B member 1-like [Bombus impatiens]